MLKNFFLLLLVSCSIRANAQKNFQYSPEKPKAGEAISFTYEPGGDIAHVSEPIEAVAYISGANGETIAQELALTRQGKKYTGKIQTDTSQYFMYIIFRAGDRIDNNYNEGIWIQLYDGATMKRGANWALVPLFGLPNRAGIDHNNDKTRYYMEEELKLHPETRKEHILDYLKFIHYFHPEEKLSSTQKEIEALVKEGINTEADAILLENLYTMAGLPQQAAFAVELKKQKFPAGEWVAREALNKFYAEKDPAKKELIFESLLQRTKTDQQLKGIMGQADSYKSAIAFAYAGKKDWEKFKATLEQMDDRGYAIIPYNYNALNIARNNDSASYTYAEAFARIAVNWAKQEMQNPTKKKPIGLSTYEWNKSRKGQYIQYANVYAIVLYKMGRYREGFPYAKEAAIVYAKGKSLDYNKMYALLAEKVLPEQQYKKELEQLTKESMATPEIKEILKRLYVKQKKTDAGFEDYIKALQNDNQHKMLEEVGKTMINEKAPTFTLSDLQGNQVDLAALKGKVVVVDFWATWCAPCKASFPAMQRVVTKYKDNPDVKFLFIDSWEKGENYKPKVADFITGKKYTFQVLFDESSEVIKDYKVAGIPAKFVIDKNGMIRFKSGDFKENEDDKLVNELAAMIELAIDPSKKNKL